METRYMAESKLKNNSDSLIPITVARGDGIGPEIMDAVLEVLRASGARIAPEFIDIGEQVYLSGNTSGIADASWDSIRRTKIFLKAPITTPFGGGYKSLNVTVRKSLGLFANVRPCRSLHPYVPTKFPELDVVIIRENEEDLYAGIEHQQTVDVVQALKLITRPGSERIIRYAFEYARAYGRKKVTCLVKDNIMKHTDGLFHSVFDEIGKEYPDIIQESQIIDIGSARLAARPEDYDVVVTSNLYGDIVSDIVAEVAGSVGMAGSSNVGKDVAMFEAIHGSAPDIAGKGIANPSGLLNGAIMMLMHIGQTDVAEKIYNAWLKTIEDGIHTGDIYSEDYSKAKVGTRAFAEAVIERFGQKPAHFPALNTENANPGGLMISDYVRKDLRKELVGVDVFVDWQGDKPDWIGDKLVELSRNLMTLKMITNRGVKVYPGGFPETFCTDHWRCRFIATQQTEVISEMKYTPINYDAVLELLKKFHENGIDVIKTENLYNFDGKRGFSLGQGE